MEVEQFIRQIDIALAGIATGLWLYVTLFLAKHGRQNIDLQRQRFMAFAWVCLTLAIITFDITFVRIQRYPFDGPISWLEWLGNIVIINSFFAAMYLIHIIRKSDR